MRLLNRWTLIWIAIFAAVALPFAELISWLRIDPLDRFEVVSVVSNTDKAKHAVVYQYHHADSSSDDVAVWIETGTPPSVGDKTGMPGQPALVWSGRADELELTWPSGDQSLTVRIARPIDVVNGASSCFDMDPRPPNVLCVDQSQVQVRADQKPG